MFDCSMVNVCLCEEMVLALWVPSGIPFAIWIYERLAVGEALFAAVAMHAVH